MATERIDVYKVITDTIISKLEQGTVPWQMPWHGSGAAGAPRSLVSGKEYRGVNVFLLACRGYQSPWWLTYKQAIDRGGNVRKGERGSTCIYWNFVKRERPDGKTDTIPFLKHYTVFNASQCDGVDAPALPERPDFEPIAEAQRIADGFQVAPTVEHGTAQACYVPALDLVRMPEPTCFRSREEYYSVLFHELGHSTGHKKRLNRPTLTDLCPFGSTNYSKEELVAEMTAAFLCGHAGIENTTIDNSAAYVASWLRKLKDDPKLVISAAGQAQKAADLIRNRSQDTTEGAP